MMDRDRVEKLKAHASESDRKVIDVLFSAWESKFKDYEKDSSKSNLGEWQAAEKALKDKINELSTIYFINQDGEPFKNLTCVFEFLKASGYKIGKRKVYNDAEAGLIKMNPDRTINESEARAYAQRYLKKVRSGGGDNNGELDNIHKEKAEAELENIRMKNEKLQFDMERERKLWMRREDVETQFAIKMGAIDAQIKDMIRVRAGGWINAVGGNSKKVDVMVELMNADIDYRFNQLAEIAELELIIRLPFSGATGLEEFVNE